MELEFSPTESMACDSATIVPVVKRKRTVRRRLVPPTPAAHDISSNTAAASASASEEEAEMANCLILLAQGRGLTSGGEGGGYECTSCSKSFPAFRAPGGHRAGRKKPKPAMTDEDALSGNNVMSSSGSSLRGAKTHECAVCGSEFSSGQALGGHMRRHRAQASASSSCRGSAKRRSFFPLDLNLPAPADDDEEVEGEQLRVPTSPAFRYIVGASTLVHCYY